MNGRDERARRLTQARTEAGYPSAAAAAKARGWTVSTYNSHENGTRGFGADEAVIYGRAFRKNPGWLLALDMVQAPQVELVSSVSKQTEVLMVQASVAAGVWREHADWPQDEWYPIEVGPPPFAGAERFAVRMEGRSMDKTIPPGSNLECVRVAYGHIEPQVGDLVIAERTAHDLTEMTCKRLDQDGEDWVLRCESTDPKFADGVLRIGRASIDHSSDDETRIIGIVVNAQQSHLNRRR
ncbi:LexA family protein [Sphingomonas zeae]